MPKGVEAVGIARSMPKDAVSITVAIEKLCIHGVILHDAVTNPSKGPGKF